MFSNAGYAAKLSKNAQKSYFFWYSLHILASDQKMFCFFEQRLSKFSYKKPLLLFPEQLFVKSRVTYWKISSNLCKAHLLMQKIIKKLYHRHRSRFRYQALCRPSRPLLQVNDSTFEPSFRYMCFCWFPFNFCFHIRQVLLQVTSCL